MTGEMSSITQEGVDSDGDCWSTHAAVAKAVGGELRPFDKYQGPYVSVPGLGRMWISAGNWGHATLHLDSYDLKSLPIPLHYTNSEQLFCDAALMLVEMARAT